MVSSTNDAGTAGTTAYPQAKERSWIPTSYHIQILTQNGELKHSEDNIGKSLMTLDLATDS